jgi:hypothetical protein
VKTRVVDDLVDVHPVALREKRQRVAHTLGGFQQTLPLRVFADRF